MEVPQPSVTRPTTHGKMVPPATPYCKTIPPQGSYISKIGEGRGKVVELEGVCFYHRVSQGYHFTIAIWHIKGR